MRSAPSDLHRTTVAVRSRRRRRNQSFPARRDPTAPRTVVSAMTPRGSPKIPEALLQYLTPTGRKRLRLLGEVETEAIVTAQRMHLLRLLSSIGQSHLGLADLAGRQVVAEQPELAPQTRRIIEMLGASIAFELRKFAEHRREVLP